MPSSQLFDYFTRFDCFSSVIRRMQITLELCSWSENCKVNDFHGVYDISVRLHRRDAKLSKKGKPKRKPEVTRFRWRRGLRDFLMFPGTASATDHVDFWCYLLVRMCYSRSVWMCALYVCVWECVVIESSWAWERKQSTYRRRHISQQRKAHRTSAPSQLNWSTTPLSTWQALHGAGYCFYTRPTSTATIGRRHCNYSPQNIGHPTTRRLLFILRAFLYAILRG